MNQFIILNKKKKRHPEATFQKQSDNTNLMCACVAVGGNVCVTRVASADQTAKLQQ